LTETVGGRASLIATVTERAESRPATTAALRRVSGRRPSATAGWVLLSALLVTAALTVSSLVLYDHNETRLLRLRVRELGLVLSSAVINIQTPLASAAALADATDGSATKFASLLAPDVGAHGQFVSASLFRVGSAKPLAIIGPAPLLPPSRSFLPTLLEQAVRSPTLHVTSLLSLTTPRIGYAYHTPHGASGFVVFAESALPADRHSKLQSNSAFSDLNYVLYLGNTQRTRQLLVTNLGALPARGRRASEQVPFGDSHFTLVVTPRGSLGGSFFETLPWLIAAVGAILSFVAALLTERLASGRRRAEQLAVTLNRVAEDNRKLYTEQRSIAQELQHALMPETLPVIDGLEASARYVAGISGIDVGGDWYDLVAVDDRRVMLVVGDVSGRGIGAAATMASLRNSIIAYAAQRDGPAAVLTKLSRLVSGKTHDYFATVLCGLLDIDAHELTIASAGHLPPLLIDGRGARFVELAVGAPVGATSAGTYEETTISIERSATLIGFTDGLVERRSESLDAGLERLRRASASSALPLEQLVTRILDNLASDDAHDDTAILAIRWQS
jgi:serine phosphatase RsbU (regulator of sigma subunit)